jgi:Ser/Thr protein kinase RdoA (MazF antagonist)
VWDVDRWRAISAWCRAELGAAPRRELFARQQASEVVGVQLTDGRMVVVKTRRDEAHRAVACVAIQAKLAANGFPCARPLTEVDVTDGVAIHAEELLPGGEVRLGDDPTTAAAFGELYGRLQNLLCRIQPGDPRPLPNPAWVRWSEPVLFPLLWWQEPWAAEAPMPTVITDTAPACAPRWPASICRS